MSNELSRFSPNDFTVDKHYWSTFGQHETEISARWIVRFLQERNEGWAPFTVGAIGEFYREKRLAAGKSDDGFVFNRLLPEAITIVGRSPYAHFESSDVCIVTPHFVQCLLRGEVLNSLTSEAIKEKKAEAT